MVQSFHGPGLCFYFVLLRKLRNLEQLVYNKKSDYLFTVTVWKSKRSKSEIKPFVAGQVYRLNHVYKLQMYYKSAQGTMDGSPLIKQEQQREEEHSRPLTRKRAKEARA